MTDFVDRKRRSDLLARIRKPDAAKETALSTGGTALGPSALAARQEICKR